MRLQRLFSSLLALLAIAASPVVHATAEQDFWQWFQKHDAVLFDFEKDQERIFDQVQAALARVDPGLTFEFGPKQEGRREFVISADGIRDRFPRVTRLAAAAPALPRWKVTAFRPRRTDALDIEFGPVKVTSDSITVIMRPQGHRIALKVLMPGYTPAQRDAFLGAAFLFLDQALGEYDVAMKAGAIDLGSPDASTTDAVTLEALPQAFDALFARLQ